MVQLFEKKNRVDHWSFSDRAFQYTKKGNTLVVPFHVTGNIKHFHWKEKILVL